MDENTPNDMSGSSSMAGGGAEVGFTYNRPERNGRWRPLVAWLLAIPHFFVLYGLGIASLFLGFISTISVLILGRFPEGIYKFNAMTIRYQLRVGCYVYNLKIQVYAGMMTQTYPGFGF